jgi:hypothetical protein
MSETRSIREAGRNRPYPAQIRLFAQRPDVRSPSHCSKISPLTYNSYDNYDEYTRRQFVAKAPLRNPYGSDETPNKFADFDVFTKIRVLHQLSTWTLWNAERMRGLMEEKDNEQTQWVRLSCTHPTH